MVQLAEHPTVQHFYAHATAAREAASAQVLDAAWLRQLCREEGADDVGFVEIDRPALAEQRADILALFPPARALISLVCRMNRDPIRSPARSVANLEFHHTGDHVNEVARRVVAASNGSRLRGSTPRTTLLLPGPRRVRRRW
jgi:hypothetical protein